MNRTTVMRTAAVGGVCAVAGAAAGIAGSAAAPSSQAPPPRAWKAHPGFGHRLGPGGPVVHANAVVLNRAGTGFVQVTLDRGIVKSVSGDQLVITEGIGRHVYKDGVTLTIPSGAKVLRDRAKAALGDLRPGDRVRVLQSSEGTRVVARDPSFRPRFGPPGAWRHAGPRGFGAGGPPPPYGPPA